MYGNMYCGTIAYSKLLELYAVYPDQKDFNRHTPK